MGETTTADHGGRGRRRPGSHGGGWCRRAEPAAAHADGQLTRAGQRQKKLVRSLHGEHRLTKLGKGFFRDKCYEYLVHVPVIIREQEAQRAERPPGRATSAGTGCQ